MEELQKALGYLCEKHGPNDKVVISFSQYVDEYIVAEQMKRKEAYENKN